ncbi:MAG TPA: histidine phosphatase family protein [Reyranella sp.]|nr:histidine phosphatase family protein [Reyranella sp.]
MKTALLWRHAKSAWGNPGLDDHERPLNRRGERAAEVMAEYLVTHAPRPDLILCSTAVRTRLTLAPLMQRLTAPAPPIALEKGLYLASEASLLHRLQGLPDDVGTILLIGHNEGIGELAAALPGKGRSGLLLAAREKFPTGALAVMHASIDRWNDLAEGSAELIDFVKPKDLEPG